MHGITYPHHTWNIFCQQIGPPVLFILSEIIREKKTNEFDYLSMRQSQINISPDVIFLFITSKNMEFMIS